MPSAMFYFYNILWFTEFVFLCAMLLALYSGFTTNDLGEPYGVLGMKPRFAAYKVSVFSVISLWSLDCRVSKPC